MQSTTSSDDACPGHFSESPIGVKSEQDSVPDTGLLAPSKKWLRKWHFAAQFFGNMAPTGYRRPIPFDQIIFSRLDRWISFHPAELSREEPVPQALFSPSSIDPRLVHEPTEPIHHDVPLKLVVPHPPLQPWEDIPPYQRMRGYSDQPAYTDDYDDFLWLPRDPLSTLDLDDTVEMRLSITTSSGGSGRIGDWPPEHLDEEATMQGVRADPEWQEVMAEHNQPPLSPSGMTDVSGAFGRSPSVQSERRLIEPVDQGLSPLIGSEVAGYDGNALGVQRLRSVALAIGSLRRPRAPTAVSAETTISMQTLGTAGSHRSDSSSTPTRPGRQDSATSNLLSPMRVSTPSPIINFHPPPPEPAESDERQGSQGDSIRSLTLPAGLPPPSGIIAAEPGDVFTASLTPQSAPAQISVPPPPPHKSHHLTFAASELGRSPSARKGPMSHMSGRLRSGTVTSRTSDRSAGHTHGSRIASGGASGMLRTASILSRDRSTSSVSAAQRAMLDEVMEEERLASQSAKHDEAALNEKEKDEVLKEQDRLRRSKSGLAAESPARRVSWVESMARGASMRRRDSQSGLPPS